MKKNNLFSTLSLAAVSALALNFQACSDEPTDDPVTNNNTGYTSSDQIASSNLVAKFSFENNMDDAKGNISDVSTNNVIYGTGAKGSCFMGSTDGYALYSNVGAAVSGMQSTTVSTWVKTSNHANGAESWFQLLNDSNYWGNMFILQESGADGNDSVRIKFTVCNWDAPAWNEQWIDLGGDNRLILGNNEWHHLVCTYDAVSSKAAFYVDGEEIAMPENVTDRFGDDPANGGGPLGALKFNNATRFVFGCFDQNLPGNSPASWMKHFDGGLDEFRLYDKALAAADVKSLFDLELAGK